MKRFATLSVGCLCMIALSWAVARAADEKSAEKGPVIQASEAKDNVGKEVVVEFVVVGGRMLEDKGICFLNSSTDQNDPDGFTAFITKSGLNKFKDEAKIDDPSDHFNQKKIHVSGKVKKYKDKAEIEVNSPNQIKMVEEEGAPAATGAPESEKKM